MATRFQISWLDNPEFKDWLKEVPTDIYKARCKLCHATFSLSNMGRRAVRSHAKGKEHMNRQRAGAQSLPMLFSLMGRGHKPPAHPSSSIPTDATPTTEPNTAVQLQNNTEDIPLPPVASTSRGIKSFLVQENAVKAEILWCIHTIMTHKSMRMAEKDIDLMKIIFSDSEIAQKMKLKKTKIGYSVLYGLAPYFKNELNGELLQCTYIAVGFDEALNKVSQKTQMDINVRFWSAKENRVCTRYYTSAFLGRSTANEIRENFKACLSQLNLKRLIQVSMDGPNVNLRFYKDLTEDLINDDDSPTLLNVGTCGLHVLHGAFKKAMKSTNWSLLSFFRSLYYLFKDVPSRRALYTEYSDSNLFPLKFCSVRWLQNEVVAQRAIDMLPFLRKFVDGLKKDNKEPTSSSYKTVSVLLQDKLLEVKLAFFKSLSGEVETFLKDYQTDKPMMPFLHSTLSKVLYDVLGRFVKEEVLKEWKKQGSIKRLDLSHKNLLQASEIDIGYATRSAIRKNRPKLSDQDIFNFRKTCVTCFKTFTEKLLEKSPLKFPVTEAVMCFDPSMAANQSVGKTKIGRLLNILEEHKLIKTSAAEKAEREYVKICSDADIVSEMKAFNSKEERVDIFWRDIFNKFGECVNISNVMQIVCILYHGNANVERGFSVNAECLVENLHEDTLVAQRIVYDSVKASVEDLSNFKITKSLLHSFKNARSCLTEATKRKESEMKEKEIETQRKKKAKLAAKELTNKISEIKENANKQVNALMEEIKSLNQDFS